MNFCVSIGQLLHSGKERRKNSAQMPKWCWWAVSWTWGQMSTPWGNSPSSASFLSPMSRWEQAGDGYLRWKGWINTDIELLPKAPSRQKKRFENNRWGNKIRKQSSEKIVSILDQQWHCFYFDPTGGWEYERSLMQHNHRPHDQHKSCVKPHGDMLLQLAF